MDLFTLAAKLTLDSSEFDKGISKAERQGSSLASKLSGGLAKAGKAAAVGLAAGVSAATAAITTLTKSAVQAYGEYEQLVGGAQLVYGDAYDTVEARAKEAYKNVQMSASDYLQQVNGLAVGLKKAMGGDAQAAADLADKVVTAEADVVAAMGISQEAAQNAFNGIMRGNYTMLDNLQIGIAGTKQGMQDVIKQVNKWNKENGRATKYNIKNIADQQAALVDYVEMVGLAGYAQNEGLTTLQGSISATKAAWQNLKIAFANPSSNINDAINKFIDASKNAIKNVFPAFSNAVKGIGTAIREIVPAISAELPALFRDLLPGLLSGGVTLVSGIVQGIVDNLPLIAGAASAMVSEIIRVFQESDNPVLQLIGNGLETVEKAFQWIIDNRETVVTAIGAIAAAFAVAEIAGLAANLNPVVLAIEGIAAAAALVIANWDSIKSDWEQLWADLGSMVETAWSAVTQFFTDIAGQISSAWGAVSGWFDENVITPVAGLFNSLFASVSQIWDGVKQAISNAWGAIAGWFETTVTTPISGFFNSAFGAVKQIWDGILGAIQTAWSAVSGWIQTNVTDPITSLFNGVQSVIDGIISSLEKIFGMGDKTINVTTRYHTVTDGKGATVTEYGNGGEGIEYDEGGGGASHSFAKGSRYVPYDMTATIHRGEEILTASQARRRRDGESGVDYAAIGAMIGEAVESAIGRVGVYMSGERVADITAKRMRGNINANSRSVLKAMGG